jgi:hypothetical protein
MLYVLTNCWNEKAMNWLGICKEIEVQKFITGKKHHELRRGESRDPYGLREKKTRSTTEGY